MKYTAIADKNMKRKSTGFVGINEFKGWFERRQVKVHVLNIQRFNFFCGFILSGKEKQKKISLLEKYASIILSVKTAPFTWHPNIDVQVWSVLSHNLCTATVPSILFIQSFIHSFNYSFIHAFVHYSIHLLIQFWHLNMGHYILLTILLMYDDDKHFFLLHTDRFTFAHESKHFRAHSTIFSTYRETWHTASLHISNKE